MNEHDPLDELLQGAFDADRAATPRIDVAGPVLERIRARQRRRTTVLAGAVTTGLAALALSVQPTLEAVRQTLSQAAPGQWPDSLLLAAVLAAAGAAWLLVMEGELG